MKNILDKLGQQVLDAEEVYQDENGRLVFSDGTPLSRSETEEFEEQMEAYQKRGRGFQMYPSKKTKLAGGLVIVGVILVIAVGTIGGILGWNAFQKWKAKRASGNGGSSSPRV